MHVRADGRSDGSRTRSREAQPKQQQQAGDAATGDKVKSRNRQAAAPWTQLATQLAEQHVPRVQGGKRTSMLKLKGRTSMHGQHAALHGYDLDLRSHALRRRPQGRPVPAAVHLQGGRRRQLAGAGAGLQQGPRRHRHDGHSRCACSKHHFMPQLLPAWHSNASTWARAGPWLGSWQEPWQGL